MAIEDWIPDFDGSEDDEQEEVRCSRCRERGLYWQLTPSGWWLFDEDGAQHFCEFKAKDEFKDLGP